MSGLAPRHQRRARLIKSTVARIKYAGHDMTSRSWARAMSGPGNPSRNALFDKIIIEHGKQSSRHPASSGRFALAARELSPRAAGGLLAAPANWRSTTQRAWRRLSREYVKRPSPARGSSWPDVRRAAPQAELHREAVVINRARPARHEINQPCLPQAIASPATYEWRCSAPRLSRHADRPSAAIRESRRLRCFILKPRHREAWRQPVL